MHRWHHCHGLNNGIFCLIQTPPSISALILYKCRAGFSEKLSNRLAVGRLLPEPHKEYQR
jgi:hypothetical protein